MVKPEDAGISIQALKGTARVEYEPVEVRVVRDRCHRWDGACFLRQTIVRTSKINPVALSKQTGGTMSTEYRPDVLGSAQHIKADPQEAIQQMEIELKQMAESNVVVGGSQRRWQILILANNGYCL